MEPRVPVESILEASFTVSPQMSKTGFVAPMTPHTRGPMLMPAARATGHGRKRERNNEGDEKYIMRHETRVGRKERARKSQMRVRPTWASSIHM